METAKQEHPSFFPIKKRGRMPTMKSVDTTPEIVKPLEEEIRFNLPEVDGSLKTSRNLANITAALVAIQGEIEPAPMDRVNTHFKNKYADLASIWRTIRPALTRNNVALIQSPTFSDGRIVLITRLLHISGEWIENDLSIKPKNDTAQDVGSCITYARRYAIASLIGVMSDEDDDGNSANHREAPKPQAKATTENRTEELFSKNNVDHMSWITDRLLKDKIQISSYQTIIDAMVGHPSWHYESCVLDNL